MINRLYIPFYSHQKHINCSYNDFGIHPESFEPESCFYVLFFFLSLGRKEHDSQRHSLSPKAKMASCCSWGQFCFKKCISYLCFPSSQLASICCRLGLANSSAMSRRLEKLAANKSPNPSCFPCLEWWTTLPLIYEMIWEVCAYVCV